MILFLAYPVPSYTSAIYEDVTTQNAVDKVTLIQGNERDLQSYNTSGGKVRHNQGHCVFRPIANFPGANFKDPVLNTRLPIVVDGTLVDR